MAYSNESLVLKVDHRAVLSPVHAVPENVLSTIYSRLSMPNPEYEKNEHLGKSNWNTPHKIYGYSLNADSLIMPRGFLRQFTGIMRDARISYRTDDKRRVLPAVNFTFLGELRDFQRAAVKEMLARSFGTLCSPTGSGKTIMALYIIAHRRQPALVIVHSKELMNQWIERAEQFLGILKKEIGIIGDGKKQLGEKLTIGIVNSIYPIAHIIKESFGHIIVDEVHRCPSRMFTEAVTAFDSKYMLGLSATPFRRDRLTRLIYWNVGDRLFEISQKTLENTGDVLRAEVIFRETDFVSSFDASEQYAQMLSELTEDQDRNDQIVQDIIQEARTSAGICLILSDRKNHVETLAGMIRDQGIDAHVLHGDLSNGDRKQVVNDLNEGRIKVLCATGQLIGEGFDCKALSTLFITTPIKFSGRLIQYLGRVLRPAPGKKEARVYDYVDTNIGVLENAARARQRVYMRAA